MVIYCTILDAENWYAGGIKAMRVLKPWLTNEPEIVGILVYIFYKLMGFGIQKLPHWLSFTAITWVQSRSCNPILHHFDNYHMNRSLAWKPRSFVNQIKIQFADD